jgi:hypothetical protein
MTIETTSDIFTDFQKSRRYTDSWATARHAWSSKASAKWLEDNYGYGHANLQARPASSDLLNALQLTNPRAVTEPNAHLDRDIPRRALYAKYWEEVKAS